MIKITIEGPQGCGKTFIAGWIAMMLHKKIKSKKGAPPLNVLTHDDEYLVDESNLKNVDVFIDVKQVGGEILKPESNFRRFMPVKNGRIGKIIRKF